MDSSILIANFDPSQTQIMFVSTQLLHAGAKLWWFEKSNCKDKKSEENSTFVFADKIFKE